MRLPKAWRVWPHSALLSQQSVVAWTTVRAWVAPATGLSHHERMAWFSCHQGSAGRAGSLAGQPKTSSIQLASAANSAHVGNSGRVKYRTILLAQWFESKRAERGGQWRMSEKIWLCDKAHHAAPLPFSSLGNGLFQPRRGSRIMPAHLHLPPPPPPPPAPFHFHSHTLFN